MSPEDYTKVLGPFKTEMSFPTGPTKFHRSWIGKGRRAICTINVQVIAIERRREDDGSVVIASIQVCSDTIDPTWIPDTEIPWVVNPVIDQKYQGPIRIYESFAQEKGWIE